MVEIGGHGADVALDEKRGLLYVANMMANRVDVISTATKTVLRDRSFNVPPYPGSVSLSPDGQYLVVTHYRNPEPPFTTTNLVTIYDIQYDRRRPITLSSPPLGVAFGSDQQAFIVTMKDFQLLDPATGQATVLDTVAATAATLPVPWATFPPEIIRASVAASGDGQWIWGVAEAGPEVIFRYNVVTRAIETTYWTSVPALGPRVMSVNYDGTVCMTGWGLFLRGRILMAQFRNATGKFNIGSLAIDSRRGPYGTVYAQYDQPASAPPTGAAPVLLITDADNLTIRERLRLQEHLGGKGVLSSDGNMLYAVSDSGVTFLPVGDLNKHPRVVAKQEDVLFRGSFCDRRAMIQEIDIVDPGGGATDFSLVVTTPRVVVSPTSGVTPAKVKVTVDPNLFQEYRGTVSEFIRITSKAGINVPPSVRVLVNNREPDQRGTIVNVPGTLVDLLADPHPARNRFYILRQDKNEVLVYDAANYNHVATFRTGNTPTQMAITYDRRYMLVGNDDSQIAYVYDLDNMRPVSFIVFPSGHYPRSIACSSNALLAFSRGVSPYHTTNPPPPGTVVEDCWMAGPFRVCVPRVVPALVNSIDRIDLGNAFAVTLPQLGLYKNEIETVNTVLTVSPSGTKIFIVRDDGYVMAYDAVGDTFFASRNDFKSLSGAYAALPGDRYLVDNNLLNSSLVQIQPPFEKETGLTSGFAMFDQYGLRTTALSASAPGVIQKVEFGKETRILPTRMIEAPLLSNPDTNIPGAVFRRTLEPLANRAAIISLGTSGFTILPWNYDAWVSEPRLSAVASLADGSDKVAPGMLVTVSGTNLSLSQFATSGIPLPTILGESCLTVNGIPIPMSVMSPSQINAQLPFLLAGDATMTLRSPAGVSNNLTFRVLSTAPGVFRTAGAIPTVVRALNGELVTPSNPIHPDDWVVIYATGLGVTSPQVAAGFAAPADPLAWVLSKPEVTLGGEPLGLDYVGLVPGQVGVYQINAYVPFWVPQGWEVPLKISHGEVSTTLGVRVVK